MISMKQNFLEKIVVAQLVKKFPIMRSLYARCVRNAE
jgi:hypothetical protein